MALTELDGDFLLHKSTIMDISQRKCVAAGGVNKPHMPKDHEQFSESKWWAWKTPAANWKDVTNTVEKQKKRDLMKRENTFNSDNLAFPTGLRGRCGNISSQTSRCSSLCSRLLSLKLPLHFRKSHAKSVTSSSHHPRPCWQFILEILKEGSVVYKLVTKVAFVWAFMIFWKGTAIYSCNIL